MKLSLILIVLIQSLLSFSASAKPIVGTIEDVYCGEIDPFAIGDACIVFTTEERTGKKLGLVYRDYDWATMFVPSDSDPSEMSGDRFQANDCRKFYSKNEINELTDFSKGYFYLSCNIYGFNYFYGNTLGN